MQPTLGRRAAGTSYHALLPLHKDHLNRSMVCDQPTGAMHPTQIWVQNLWETFNYHGSTSPMLVLFDRPSGNFDVQSHGVP